MKNRTDIYKHLLGLLTKKGKTTAARRIVNYTYLDIFNITKQSVFQTTKYLLEMSGITLELRNKRRGKQFHTVPFPVTRGRQQYLSLKNFITSANDTKKRQSLYTQFSAEILKGIRNYPSKTKTVATNVYSNVEKNKGNRHFRWA